MNKLLTMQTMLLTVNKVILFIDNQNYTCNNRMLKTG